MNRFVNKKQLVAGLLAFVAGALEYLLHRPSDALSVGESFQKTLGRLPIQANLFGPFAGVAPDFFHPLAFSLVTMSVIPEATKQMRLAICLVWLTLELMLEIGQNFPTQILLCLQRFHMEKSLSPITGYLSAGTYDPWDLLAICLGIIAAYIIGKKTGVKPLRAKEGM